jgi:hypothetical protein
MNITPDFIGKNLELSPPMGEMMWEQAMAMDWPDGWRVPTRAELVTVYDEATECGHKFSNHSDVWSSSSHAPAHTGAWLVYFGVGYSVTGSKFLSHIVRLVKEVRK